MNFRIFPIAIVLASLISSAHAQTGIAPDKAERAPSPVLQCEKPVWPEQSKARQEQGTVSLRVLIDKQGSASKVKLDKSSGFPELDDVTLTSFKKCKYRVPTHNGIPVQGWVPINYVWRIE